MSSFDRSTDIVGTPQSAAEKPATPENTAPSHEGDHDGHDHPQTDAPALNPACTRQVQGEVPAEEVARAYQTVIKRYRRMARIPGFRAGKVPESVVRAKFADDLHREVVEALLPIHLRKALEAEGLRPVSQPQMTDLRLEEGGPLHFGAVFEVLPELDVTGHQEVKVERPDVTLTDEEHNAEMARIRDAHATMETVAEERPLADGDFAVVRYRGTVQGAAEDAPERPIEGEDVTIEVGSPKTLDAFNNALRGATIGQQLQVEVAYPEEFNDAHLAGKSVAYDVEVKAIQKKVLPELDDDFAKQMGENETLAAFQEKLREQLANEKRRRLEAEARDKLIAALVERFPFPVPESLVQQQVDVRLDRGLRALAAQGMTTEMLRQLDFERLRAAQREMALKEVKGALILDRIAELEQVEVADNEVEAQLQMLSYQTREPLETLRKRLTEDGGLAKIREQMRRDKVLHLLYERMPA